jgi:threonine/homoserine/homoserine lactone efflux protein
VARGFLNYFFTGYHLTTRRRKLIGAVQHPDKRGGMAMTLQLFSFLGSCLAIIVVPGPDLVLLLRNAAAAGRRAAAATASGIMVGNATLAMTAVAGLTALLQSSEQLYNAVRIAGAAYLIYLGLRSILAFVRHKNSFQSTECDVAQHRPAALYARRSQIRSFRQGLLSNLLNPKVAAFYLALFPQFSLPGLPTLAQHSVLAGLFCLLALIWYTLVIFLLDRFQAWLQRGRIQRGIAGLSGGALLGLGINLALRS